MKLTSKHFCGFNHPFLLLLLPIG